MPTLEKRKRHRKARETQRKPTQKRIQRHDTGHLPSYIGTVGMAMDVVRFARDIHVTPFKLEVLGKVHVSV